MYLELLTFFKSNNFCFPKGYFLGKISLPLSLRFFNNFEEIFSTDALTMIASNKLLKTIAWFDNGWGFASRILELAESYSELEGS